MKRSEAAQGVRVFALWAAFFLSGAAALGYQIVWSKMLAAGLGHEFHAVMTVVAAFFSGMALGARFSQLLLRSPAGAFAFCILEFVIGMWGGLLPGIIGRANELFSGGAAANSIWVFVTLLPATAAMGATLPTMAALCKNVRGAYAMNTAGAVAGCLLTPFFLMPHFDFSTVCRLLALGNIAAAILAAAFCLEFDFKKSIKAVGPGSGFIFAVTGFLALGFETLGVRLLSQSVENTIFSFATILAVYLLGQAAGAALFRIWRPQTSFLLMALAIACAGSVWVFQSSGNLYEPLRVAWGDSVGAVAAAELVVAAAVYLIPTILMGGLFADLAEREEGMSLGTALGWNSVGAGFGAVVVPALIFPALGGYWTLALLTILYLCLAWEWKWPAFASVAVVLALFAAAPRPLTLARVAPGQKVFTFKEGRMANVMVTEGPDGNRTLFVNNRFQMGGTAARNAELRHGHIPLLLHPDPKRALFLGLGTGISLSSAAVYTNLVADGVELLPEVVDVMPGFFADAEQSPLKTDNIRIHVADARRFIRNTTNLYDVIVADLFHPAQDGIGFLYTSEHFDRIHDHLTENGLFCQWLPLHQMDLQTVRDITKTFVREFRDPQVWILRFNVEAPVIGLIGWGRERAARSEEIESRMAGIPKLSAELRRLGLADSVRFFGNYVAAGDALQAFAEPGRQNTDEYPIVMYEAPLMSYRKKEPPYMRLLAFLDEFKKSPAPIVGETRLQVRIENYVRARDIYLRALAAEAAGKADVALDGYVESARVSEEFTSGYAQGIVIATAKAKSDPEGARRILERLMEAQPGRSVAKEMLERMGQ